MTKRCSKCGQVKSLAEFNKSSRAKDGRFSWCRECSDQFSRRFYQEKGKANRRTPKGAFGVYKTRARIKNISFDLTLEQFSTFWQKPCHYCGDEISTIGLDRVVNSIGYTIENIVPCCQPCNLMKREFSTSEFFGRCEKIINHNRVETVS